MTIAVKTIRIALVAREPTATTVGLAAVELAWAELVTTSPEETAALLRPGDVALGRLDVRASLDGVEEGLWALGVLGARGVRVLNGPGVLLAAHDKLVTARVLRGAGLPHPRTHVVRGIEAELPLAPPVIVKPRYGSWGRAVVRVDDAEEFAVELRRIAEEPWYRVHGALVQELVPPVGHDLRLIVADGEVVGAIRRVAAAGEWRTNVALGATRVSVSPSATACALGRAAASAIGASLVGVDLLPDGRGGWSILELNGAVEFNGQYGPSVFRRAALSIVRAARDCEQTRSVDDTTGRRQRIAERPGSVTEGQTPHALP